MARILGPVVALLLALPSCAGRPASAPPAPVPPAAAAMLAGWQLTLPVAGSGGGAARGVVKQERSGNAHTDLPLLSDVPLGASFDYSISDDGEAPSP